MSTYLNFGHQILDTEEETKVTLLILKKLAMLRKKMLGRFWATLETP